MHPLVNILPTCLVTVVWMWYRKCWGALFPQSRETLSCPKGTQLLALWGRPWGSCGWNPVKGRQHCCPDCLCSSPSTLLCVPVATGSTTLSYTVQPAADFLVGDGTTPWASLKGQMQILNTMGLGEAWNDVWLGFIFSAVAVTHTMAVFCGAEVI